MKKIISTLLIFAMLFVTVVSFASCDLSSYLQTQSTIDANRVILKTEMIEGCLWITYEDAPEVRINVGRLSEEETTLAGTTPEGTTPDNKPEDNTPVAKDYQLVAVNDSAISNGKVSNHALALVIGAGGKIVSARFDCAEIKPELDEGSNLLTQAFVATKIEQGDNYGGGYGMHAGSWADQAKACEDYIVGKTADEVANLDLTLIAGCTMKSTTPLFQALVAKAFASNLKVSFSTADEITLGLAIDSTVSESRGNASVSSDFAGVVIADGKVVATMLDSCEQKFSIEGGALEAPETPAVSKNDQGDYYVMPNGAWYAQAQAFANFTIGKTVAELADLETISDALAAAGCTMRYTIADYKVTIIKAAGYAR